MEQKTQTKETPSTALFDVDGGTAKALDFNAKLHLIFWGKRYGLDAYAGHVVMMYGRPFVTRKGALAHATKHSQYAGYTTRYLSDKNLSDEYGLDPDEIAHAWECSVYVKHYSNPITDFGIVTKKELEEARRGKGADFLPVAKEPSRQAQTRAIRRAVEAAFPLNAEGAYEPEDDPEPYQLPIHPDAEEVEQNNRDMFG